MEDKSKIFVKIEDYKDIKDILDLMKGKIKEAKEVLDNIYEIKSKEDEMIAKWNSNIKEVDERVDSISRSLRN